MVNEIIGATQLGGNVNAGLQEKNFPLPRAGARWHQNSAMPLHNRLCSAELTVR